MAAINTVPKSIHLPLTNLGASRVLMCSASVGSEGSVTLQLRNGSSALDTPSNSSSNNSSSNNTNSSSHNSSSNSTATTATAATTATPTNVVTVLETSATSAAATLENALTIGYPDPDMLADVLGSIQTASLKNKRSSNSNVNSNSSNCKQRSSNLSSKRILNSGSSSGIQLNNPNKITITRRSASSKISVQTVSASTNTTISSINSSSSSSSNSNGSSSVSKTNYIKNCLIRSSSCSNTITNVTTLAQIMSNSSTSSAASLLSQHNNNSNCSNSSNFSNASSVGSSISIGSNNTNSSSSNSSNSNSNCNSSNSSSNGSNSNDSNSSSGAHSLSFKSNTRPHVAGVGTAAASTNTTATGTAIVNVESIPRKSRPKLSSPTRHGPQQCQICSKIFGNASALAKHKLTHSDERKYICALCSKAFKRQDHLNGHMMTHRNKKPYECKADGCGKSYCDARSLRRHSENHHGGVAIPSNNSLSPTTTASGSAGSSGSGSNSGSNSSSSGVGVAASSSLSLSPATANGDASSPDGATCIRTYISTGSSVVDAATGIALSDEQIKAMNLPIKTGVTLLSPTTSTSSNASSTASSSSSASSSLSSSSSCSSSSPALQLASSPTIMLSDGATLEGEGLTREQLDLISKIMQQTKQTSAQVTVSSPTSVSSYKINTETAPVQARPRTWNMQLLNNAQNVTVTVEDGTDLVATTAGNASNDEVKEEEQLSQQLVATLHPHLLNIVKIEKPVECNLCHRKFKNIPALNGHMRLHGGYFKKDPETKRSEKRDNSGPPLQTASIGVRALIEEKIISKRKDITKGAFVVPAPPSHSGGAGVANCSSSSSNTGGNSSSSNGNNSASLRRSISDLESFLNPKSNCVSSITQTMTSCSSSSSSTGTTTAVLPAATTIKSSNGLSIQQIGLPQSIEIFSGGQRQPKTLSLGSGANTITITTNNVPTTTTMSALSALKGGTSTSLASSSPQPDPKDSTLIELLKRGTRIAVTSSSSAAAKKAQPGNLLLSHSDLASLSGTSNSSVQTSRQIITNNNRTVIIPSDVHVMPTKSKLSACMSSNAISLPDGTPLSLTIAPSAGQDGAMDAAGGLAGSVASAGAAGVGGVYTVTYTSETDAGDLFDDAEVYNVSDTEMLLQTVDSMELLNEDDVDKSEHSEDFALLREAETQLIKLEPAEQQQQQTTTPLPTFQQFHSKELIMQNSSQIQAIANMRSSSPLHSPLAYPTPPSSHETVAQSSPFIEDAAAQFVDASNTFFGDKTDFSHVYFKTDETHQQQHQQQQHQLSENDNEKILKLKTVLEESSFDPTIKVEDLLNGTEDDAECDLREFAETNLSFLDEDQEFLNDSRNATSPLSESFFTSGLGSAEDVKQVLREVLPDENMQLQLSSTEQQGENIIDLYYLPGLGLQSQMMSNSDDPLLSSSPREFGSQQRQVIHATSSSTGAMQAMEALPAGVVSYEQQQQEQQQQQDQSQQQQSQQLLQLLPQQQQQQQQQADFMLPSFSQVSCQTQYLDASQQSMTLQPLNSLLQPFLYCGGGGGVAASGDKQEYSALLNSHVGQGQGQATIIDANLLFTCGATINASNNNIGGSNSSSSNISNNSSNMLCNKPLPAALPTPLVTPTPSVSILQPLSNQTNSILKRRLRSNGAHDAHKFSKFHTLSPHRSKLRKPSRTHYTPAPILNPDRKGTGLYCNVRKQLGQGLFDVFDDDFGDPVGLVDFSDESKVNLGSTYQAQIPPCKSAEERAAGTSSMGADLMWDPSVQLDEKILMRYIDLSKSSAVPMGSHSEEVALHTLLEAKGNSAAAVLTLLQTQSSAFQMKWTAYELEQFLRGLEKHGKDFGKIASELFTKTSGECVQMYYFWKKLCVDYKVSHLKMEPVPPSTPVVEQKPYVCEMADCSASFSSKAALHGHVRIHAYNRNNSNSHSNNSNHNHNNNNNSQNSSHNSNSNSNSHQQHSNSNSNNNNSNSNNSNACATPSSSNSSHCLNAAAAAAAAPAAAATTLATTITNNNNNNNSNACGSSSSSTTLLMTAATSTAAKDNCNNSNIHNSSSNNHQHHNSSSSSSNNNSSTSSTSGSNILGLGIGLAGNNSNSNMPKDSEFPCKVCGKVFNKVKSRSAHMKTHRVQDTDQSGVSSSKQSSNGNQGAVTSTPAAANSAATLTTLTPA